MADWLEEGQKAPDFSLPDADGRMVSLADFRGKTVVLYFYPKDMTPGCTAQACAFRDFHAEFERLNVAVVGVSADPPAAHQKFMAKHGLNFILLSDPEHRVLERYGAWREKVLYGIRRMGIVRSTYVIDEAGMIQKLYKKASALNNAADVLALLEKSGL